MFGIHAKMMCYSPIYGIYAADVPQKAGGCPTQHVYIFFLNNGHLSDRCSSRDVIYRLKPGISQVAPSPYNRAGFCLGKGDHELRTA